MSLKKLKKLARDEELKSSNTQTTVCLSLAAW